MKRLALIAASIFGAGYFPVASGTLASALAVLPYLWLRPYPAAYTAAILILCALGVWSAGVAEEILHEKDSHKIVIDEVAGYLIAAAFLPWHWFYPVAAFCIFRVLDVTKPYPARQLQALPGGLGVMIDDVIVAVYTNLLLQGARLFLPF